MGHRHDGVLAIPIEGELTTDDDGSSVKLGKSPSLHLALDLKHAAREVFVDEKSPTLTGPLANVPF